MTGIQNHLKYVIYILLLILLKEPLPPPTSKFIAKVGHFDDHFQNKEAIIIVTKTEGWGKNWKMYATKKSKINCDG